ncbi:MAG: hypothetical protein CMF22_12130 [Idiomarinaceae bacterium]|mgnify:CR=1 FL=1|nr:hypothetical protein [Idiomarinaceae bacterium]|tara:strand:+ start:903 stop:1382 length:480 start_codon:yes stop_codon:yes gene_type:complete
MSSFFVSITAGQEVSADNADSEVTAINHLAALEDVVFEKTALRPCLGGGRINHDEIVHKGWDVDGKEITNILPRLGYFVSSMAEAYGIIGVAPKATHSVVAYLDTSEPAGIPMPARFIAGTGKWSGFAYMTPQKNMPAGHLPVFKFDSNGMINVISMNI